MSDLESKSTNETGKKEDHKESSLLAEILRAQGQKDVLSEAHDSHA